MLATGKTTPYVGEVLDAAFSLAGAVFVLMTPDDEARLRAPYRTSSETTDETELTPQARPNVLFEAGMAIGRDPNKTVLVELGQLRHFSDIGGRHVIKLDDSTQRRQDLAQRLQLAKCHVDLSGTAWHTAGKFIQSITDSVSSTDNEEDTQIAPAPRESLFGTRFPLWTPITSCLLQFSNDWRSYQPLGKVKKRIDTATFQKSVKETVDKLLECVEEGPGGIKQETRPLCDKLRFIAKTDDVDLIVAVGKEADEIVRRLLYDWTEIIVKLWLEKKLPDSRPIKCDIATVSYGEGSTEIKGTATDSSNSAHHFEIQIDRDGEVSDNSTLS